ncbi:uncharacterized protein [Anabrus simplex]|uniref:uncharacterized protein n=1 Tax=Anabrus simplex TaxID=316456 RepID=UPI0034DDB6DA
MWVTLDLLVQGRHEGWGENQDRDPELVSNVQEWLDSMTARANTAPEQDEEGKGIPELPIARLDDVTWDSLVAQQVVDCSFSHPAVRSRLEQLMGSNVVRITDRRYMQTLQQRIREDHMQCLEKRIKEREEEEFEREKQLILDGKLPLECAGKELANHPVFKISKITSQIIEKRRSKFKVKKLSIPYYPLEEGEAEGEIGWKEAAAVAGEGSMTHVDEVPEEQEVPSEPTSESRIQEDVAKGYLFPQEVFERLKYESPLIKELRQLETVDELYKLADKIVGPLKSIKLGTCK